MANGSPSSGRRAAKRASRFSLELHESKVRKNNAIASASESFKERLSLDLSSNRSVGRVGGKKTMDEALAHGELIEALDRAVKAKEKATYVPLKARWKKYKEKLIRMLDMQDENDAEQFTESEKKRKGGRSSNAQAGDSGTRLSYG